MIDAPAWLKPRLAALHDGPHRTGSLIVSLYGDAIVPRGGALAVATLVEIMAAMGLGSGVVRTAVSRLVQEGWLEREEAGRRGVYRLAAPVRDSFAQATRLIYGPPPDDQDDGLVLVVLADPERRDAARTALAQAGFGFIAPTVAVAPRSRTAPPGAIPPGAIRLHAAGASDADLTALARLAWPLEEVASRYRRFIEAYAAAAAALARPKPPEPLVALVARVLLIHDFRRVILRDPMLPAALLPRDWPGTAARRLCARLYSALVGPAERWLDANASNGRGPLPGPDASFASRFRDLAGVAA
ncbi:MAG: PaaX family transcriptional regulator C-terminal domain-containing protein [Acetobacteraceae bacterium]